MIFRPAGRFFTLGSPPAASAARIFAARHRPPRLFFAIAHTPFHLANAFQPRASRNPHRRHLLMYLTPIIRSICLLSHLWRTKQIHSPILLALLIGPS
jgi:hypothetical protein